MTKEYSTFLEHHGVKGQKWGVRRYQNEDGSLTKDGRVRYQKETVKQIGSMMESAKRKDQQSDRLYKDAKRQYKSLGNNLVERVNAVSDEKNKKAEKYRKTMDRSSALSDEAYDTRLKASQLYKTLGRTPFSRMNTMIKYDKRRDKPSEDWANAFFEGNYGDMNVANKKIKDLNRERRQLARMANRGY
jgi:hypothetical protein